MNIEFHYYILNMLCRYAGFDEEEARVISYASQFVDYNLVSYTIDTAGKSYHSIPTQNYGFWSSETPRQVYVPFHFVPGEIDHGRTRRKDGRTNRLDTTPDSPAAKQILISALKSRDLYRVGIALHTYADTWAHQNFSGIRETWNSCDEGSIIPPIGHAQMLKTPDLLAQRWEDPRLLPPHRAVDNRERVFAAARKIYKYLCTYNRRPFSDADLVMDMLAARLGRPGAERPMEERILDLTIEENIERFDRTEWVREAIPSAEIADDSDAARGYDKILWLRDEVLYRSKLVKKKAVPALRGFYSSHFYRFNEAAKAQLETAYEAIPRDVAAAI